MAAWWKISLAVVCSLLSGVFAGLTLGMMSLDLIDLRVLADSGTEKEKWYAEKIIPVRKRGNFLLCTLLVGNTAVNVASSIITADIFGGIVGFVTSTIVILYIGEIIPQAICHRFGLVIGAYAVPFIKLVMVLTALISYPTSKVLDYFLGGEPPTRYNKSQLKSLLSIHGSHPPPDPSSAADSAEKGLHSTEDSRYVLHTTASNGEADHTKNRFSVDRDPYQVWTTSGTSDDGPKSMLESTPVTTATTPDAVPVVVAQTRFIPSELTATSSTEIVAAREEPNASGAGASKCFSVLRKKSSDRVDKVEKRRSSLLSRLRSRGSAEKPLSTSDLIDLDRSQTKSEERESEKDRSKKDPESPQKPLTHSEITILGGAFDFSHKTVLQVMTPLNSVFMLDASKVLDFDTLLEIFQSGHSRIPVYDGVLTNIIGVLFAKDLILLDPEDCVPIRTVLLVFGRKLLAVMDSTPLDAMLNIFKTGGGHLALVQKVINKGTKEESHETLGVCTLEDLIEELIGQDIVDETDVFTDNIHHKRVRRDRRIDLDVLKMLDGKQHDELLSDKEVKVVAAYLGSNFDAFAPSVISPEVLLDFLAEAPIVECLQLPKEDDDMEGIRVVGLTDVTSEGNVNGLQDVHCENAVRSSLPSPLTVVGLAQGSGNVALGQGTDDATCQGDDQNSFIVPPEKVPDITSLDKSGLYKEILIYRRNVPTQDAYLIINGKLEITAGHEGFVSTAGPWTLLAGNALTDDLYAPDFTARIVEAPARLLRIRRPLYRRMVRYSGGGESGGRGREKLSQNRRVPDKASSTGSERQSNSLSDAGTRIQPLSTVTVRKQMREKNLQWSELATEKVVGEQPSSVVYDRKPEPRRQINIAVDDDGSSKPWKSLDEGDLSLGDRLPDPDS